MAVASLVLGILGLLMVLIPSFGMTALIGLLMGIVALILGIIGRKKAVEQQEATGLATAGLVLGIISLVLGGAIFAACTYCQHKVGKAMEQGFGKGLKGVKAFARDLFAVQTCSELTPAGECRSPRSFFTPDTPQVHVVYRTRGRGETYSVRWYKLTESGSSSSSTLLKEARGRLEQAIEANEDGVKRRVVRATLPRPAAGWQPGAYRVKVKVGRRSIGRRFRIASMPTPATPSSPVKRSPGATP